MRTAAVMMVMDDQKKILSVSRRTDTTRFGLPGGKSEPGEDPMQTAIRETYEETGIAVQSCFYLTSRVEYGPDQQDFYTHCYYAVAWSGTPESKEEGRVAWLTEAELTGTKGAFAEYNRHALEKLRAILTSTP